MIYKGSFGCPFHFRQERKMTELHNFIDADTILVSACMMSQTNYVVYTKEGKRVSPAKSKKNWCELNPKKDPNDYNFVQEATLIQKGFTPTISICKSNVTASIKRISDKYPDHKTWVCIEGEGNYRDDLYPYYKGNRNGEILLRRELSQWVIDTFPRVIVSEGCETDDTVATQMWKGHQDFLKTGVHTRMISCCDKDLMTVAGKLYNYGKDKEHIIDELEADRWFCTQLLYGDSTDNIKGINNPLPEEFLKKYGVRANAKGVGEKTAAALVAGLEKSSDCFERVIEAYREVYGDEWLPALQEEAIALRMCHHDYEKKSGTHYKIENHLRELGINARDY